MKSLWSVAAGAMVLALVVPAASAAPLFVNPGFETGDFFGWTVTVSSVGGASDGILEGLLPGDTGGGTGYEEAVVVPIGWGTDPYTSDVVPKVAPVTFQPNVYSARIGDADNQINHVPPPSDDDPQSVTLSQTGTVTELTARLAVQWSAAVCEPLNWEEHIDPGFPYFSLRVVNLTQGVELLNVTHTSHELGAFWDLDGAQAAVDDPNNRYGPTVGETEGDWWYKDWTTESWDMSGANLGDQILIELTAHDCGLRGHPAYVRLDEIGIAEVPPIPEPTTILLLVGGLTVAAWRARRRFAA